MKDLPGYEGRYAVTKDGRVWSYYRKRFLSPFTNCAGYKMVSIWKDRASKYVGIHRLVALTYIPNPLNKPHVNHKDFNPANNNVDNLEWVTPKENIAWSDKYHRRDEYLKRSIKLATQACKEKKSWKKGIEKIHKYGLAREASKRNIRKAIQASKDKKCWKIGVEKGKKETKLFYKGNIVKTFPSKIEACKYAKENGCYSFTSLLRNLKCGEFSIEVINET